MKHSNSILSLFSLGFALGLFNMAIAEEKSDKARVLILGDSISIGYTPVVQRLLKDQAVVVRPMRGKRAENSAGTINGVQHVDRWLKLDGGNWDVIHFNFGLHDLKRVHPETNKNSNDPKHPHQSPPDRYEKQLSEITAKLAKTGAKLIFATTTPVPEGGVKPHRDVKDVERYNTIARRAVKPHAATINDLYQLTLPQLSKIQRPVNVHFNKAGNEALGEAVSKQIRAALAEGDKQ